MMCFGRRKNLWRSGQANRLLSAGFVAFLFFCAAISVIGALPGDLDAAFDTDGRTSLDVETLHNEAFAVHIQSDGKILVAGNEYSASPDRVILVRYNANGSLDTNFASGGVAAVEIGGVSCQIRSIAVQTDGKILLAGQKTVGFSSSDFLVVRFRADGTLDQTFDADGWTTTSFSHNDTAFSMVLQPNGKIVVAGFANRESNVYEGDMALARYNADGSLDTTFDQDGKLLTAFDALSIAYSIAVQPDGKIVVAGENQLTIPHSNADFAVARYNPDGSLDQTFGTGGRITVDFNNNTYASARSLAILADGKIVIGGETIGAGGLDFALARLHPTGALDSSFGTNGKTTTNVAGNDNIGETRSLAVQTDGKIILAGACELSADNSDFAVVRYAANGALDSSFGTGGKVITDFGSAGDIANAVVLQSDGKIVVAGKAMLTFLSGTNIRYADFAVARYHAREIAPPRTPFDFDGDGKADISVFRPSEANWYVLKSTGGFFAAHWGISTDKIMPGDYDGDGKTDLAIFRRGENSTWYIFNSQTNTFRAEQWGATNFEQQLLLNDSPVPADYDGDGKTDLAVWRLTDNFSEPARFLIKQSSNNSARVQKWGNNSDRPVPADFDGDSKADLAIYRGGEWWILNSSDNSVQVARFGLSQDKIVPADYDADGKADLAVYRGGTWYILRSAQGFTAFQFGLESDTPAPADYDGDNRADPAVYRNGTWYLLQSANGIFITQFGLAEDVPIASAFVR